MPIASLRIAKIVGDIIEEGKKRKTPIPGLKYKTKLGDFTNNNQYRRMIEAVNIDIEFLSR